MGSPRDAATLAFNMSMPLEDFVDPAVNAGPVQDLNLGEVKFGLREFLLREQTGARRVARELFRNGRRHETVARWASGERTVRFLIGRGRLEIFEASDLAASAAPQVERATRRLEATARAALENGDLDGAYAAAYDSYRMAAEALLARQGLRATGGDGSHMAVEDAVSAQFAAGIPAFAKPAFERFRRTRHTAQYFDPSAAPITKADAEWAIEKAAGRCRA